MPIEVTIRHQNAAPGIKEYAELRAAKLMEQFPKIESVHVIVDVSAIFTRLKLSCSRRI